MSNKIVRLNSFETNKIPNLDQINNSSYELLNYYLQHDFSEFEKILLKDKTLCNQTLDSLSYIINNIFIEKNNPNYRDGLEYILEKSKENNIFNYESIISLSLSLSLQSKWISSLDNFNKVVGKQFYLEHIRANLYLAYNIFEKNPKIFEHFIFSDLILLLSIHNIGLAIISGLFRIEYSMLVCLTNKNPLSSLEVVERNLSTAKISNNSCGSSFLCHAKIGAIALNKWGLPRKFVDSVLLHHKDNYEGPFKDYIYFVQLCNNILSKYQKSDVRVRTMPSYISQYFNGIDLDISLSAFERNKDKELDLS